MVRPRELATRATALGIEKGFRFGDTLFLTEQDILGDRLARDIAIRDPEDSDALIGTAVPEELRDRVRAILDARD